MKYYLLILLPLLPLSARAQARFDPTGLSHDGRLVLEQIKHDQDAPMDTMGLRFGNLPKDYPLTMLRERVSVAELKNMTNHDNPLVRCYAFKALTMVSEPDAFLIVTTRLQDSAKVSATLGCIATDQFVGDFFIRVFKGHEAIVKNPAHIRTLDSLLIFEPNKLNARSEVMRWVKPEEKYYQRIREVVKNEKDAGALIGLAKFEKEDDIELIITTQVKPEWPYDRFPQIANFVAIEKFPHPAFLPFLQASLKKCLMTSPGHDAYFLYQAIAAYDNKNAHALLSQPFHIKDNTIRHKHLEELSDALRRDSHPLYHDLREQLNLILN